MNPLLLGVILDPMGMEMFIRKKKFSQLDILDTSAYQCLTSLNYVYTSLLSRQFLVVSKQISNFHYRGLNKSYVEGGSAYESWVLLSL